MPLYMDVHNMEGGVSAGDVAGAHQKDVETQSQYGVNYKKYWVDESQGKIFCLVEAPDAGSWPTRSTRCRKARRSSVPSGNALRTSCGCKASPDVVLAHVFQSITRAPCVLVWLAFRTP
jgi:hypothetical protein